jgi:hypothetical protein
MIDRERRLVLVPTSAGTGVDANGRVEVRAHGGEQHFEVGVDAAVSDGTTFIVMANDEPAGAITIAAGNGDLHLTNVGATLPHGIDPVDDLLSVEVTDGRGTVILLGYFDF